MQCVQLAAECKHSRSGPEPLCLHSGVLSHLFVNASKPFVTQLYGHSRQGDHGVCQGISMGSETLTTTKQFTSVLPQN